MPENAKLWSPDSPFLYTLKVTLKEGNKIVDKVDSYAAMRKYSTRRDANGIVRLELNNEALFQFGPLDQGWWPDGLYTAPTDEALLYDIQKTKDFGYNMIRKHIKVEPARWYTYCDQLGIIVWQDMPSGDRNPQWQNRKYFDGTEHPDELSRFHPTVLWNKASDVLSPLTVRLPHNRYSPEPLQSYAIPYTFPYTHSYQYVSAHRWSRTCI